jgi:predicted nucleic acid-binding protein
MAILDTNLLVGLQKGNASARKLVQEQVAGQAILRIPAVAWVEFLSALPDQARREAERRLSGSTQFVAFDFAHAQVAVKLQHDLMVAGMRLGWSDAQIAATAIQAGEPLLSNDVAFDRVPGLQRLGF